MTGQHLNITGSVTGRRSSQFGAASCTRLSTTPSCQPSHRLSPPPLFRLWLRFRSLTFHRQGGGLELSAPRCRRKGATVAGSGCPPAVPRGYPRPLFTLLPCSISARLDSLLNGRSQRRRRQRAPRGAHRINASVVTLIQPSRVKHPDSCRSRQRTNRCPVTIQPEGDDRRSRVPQALRNPHRTSRRQ